MIKEDRNVELRTPAELSKIDIGNWTAAEREADRLHDIARADRENAASLVMDDVREYAEGQEVSLVPREPNPYDNYRYSPTAEEGTRWAIVALNEGGHNSTAVDLLDLIEWVAKNRPDLLTGIPRTESPTPPSESVESAPINWSYVQHTVGDMHDDEEYQPVRVQLPGGSVVEAGSLVKDAHGQWVLVANARPA